VHVGQWSVVIGEFALQRIHHSQLTIRNNGFDLSLSFSLVKIAAAYFIVPKQGTP